MQGNSPIQQAGMPPRNPSAQGYMNQQQQQQQHPQYPQHAVGSPMLSPPVGFSPQQARAGSPGQFHPQGTMAPRSPGAMQSQPLPNMNMASQYASPPSNQGFAPQQQSSYMNAAPDVNGLSQHMSHMNMASPGLPAQNIPFASPPLQHADGGPAKGKRAARAYHQEATPLPQQQQQQYQQPAQYQNQQYQQQQQGNNFPPQHPYANAPPPGPQPYQQQPAEQQARPDYLQHEQPQGQVFPGNGIPQPPHNPGTKMPGLRNRIDPEQIPSVVTVQEQDQEIYDNDYFLTCSRGTVPLATTDYTAVDQGSSSPRFMRLSTYNIPATDDLASMSHVPIAIVLQPFAQPHVDRGEEPIYTVDFSEHGPPRCKRCRGYVNPWFMFTEAGQKFVCNLCGSASEVPPEYFSHLDVNGRRLDLEQRPELLRGTVDMIVPKDYWVQDPPAVGSGSTLTIPRPPQPLHYIFAIDVSCDTSHRRGGPQDPEMRAHPMLREVTRALKEIIYGNAEEEAGEQENDQPEQPKKQRGGLPAGAKVAIVTFDKVVHFYNVKAGLDKPQMLVVGDIDDMFVPLSEGFLVDAWESRSLLENLLDSIPEYFTSSTTVEAAMGGPLKASLLALKNIGGQLNIFQTRLPTVGPGALKHRDEAKVQGTDKEKTLFVPQDPFYRTMAEEAVEAGVGINLFLFPSQFIDVASLGVLAGLTGGDVFFHPRFDPVRDGLKLHSQLARVLTRETAYSVTMRIRCSEGLRVAEHFGNFYQRNVTDLEFGSMDTDKAVAALVKHETKLDDKRDAHFQCAVLYTSETGQRRVRLHNVAVPVTQVMSNVFRFADMDATMTYCTKEAIAKSLSKPLRDVREGLTELCTKVLLAYRKHCASTTSPGQLILPESFKLFPVYALSFNKTKAMKGGPVVSDVRTFYMRWIKSMGASDVMDLLYPKMMPIHTLSPEAVQPDEHGRVKLPRLMRCSYARMEPHGAYLIQNGDIAIIWLGQSVSPQILQDVYGVDSLDELSTRMTRLPNLPTRLSEQLRLILSTWEHRRGGRRLPLYLARQNIDGIEVEFSNMLVEDANNDALSYVDYLCLVHKNIQQELSGEKQQSEIDAQTMWRTW